MVIPRFAGVLLAALAAGPAVGLEIRACALVQSRAAKWQPVPANAVVDQTGLSFKRKVYLEGRQAIPVRAPEVRAALREATQSLGPDGRADTGKILGGLERWAQEALTETPGPLACPSSWRTAAEVLKERKGNSFELVRALTALLRAAGIPARPSFNGLPVVCLYAVPRGKSGFWTVWDPLHPSASLRRLPVLWLPLRAEEVPLVVVKPAGIACEPAVEGRRYASRDEAKAAFDALKSTGRFPENVPPPLPADLGEWWEVWSVGAAFGAEPGEDFTVSFPLPFVTDEASRCGTREHAVWCSEPARLRGRPEAHTQADQQMAGLVMNIRVKVRRAVMEGRKGG